MPNSSTFTPTSAGTYYWQAVYSGDSNNNGASSHCSSEPPEGLAKIFLGYADTYFPRGTGLPSIWNGSPGVIFVGCGVNANEGGPAVADTCPQEPVGPPRDEYDAGAIRIDNPSATAPLVVGGPANVTIGSCVYSPWPGLKRTIPPGGTLILTQTGLTGDPCGQNLGGNYNFDTSESSGNGNCIPSPAVPAVTFTLNGSPTTIDDGAQILNQNGTDPGACTGVNEFEDWTQVHGEVLTVVDAQILISGNSTNAVNTPHTFTVTVNQNLGDGHGFVPVTGATVTPALSYSNGATAQAATGTCTTGTTNSSGQCTIIVNSTTAGLVTVNASTNLTVSGQSITRTTGDGLSGDSSNATKTYVDSYITISPASANNPLNATHTLTTQLFVDAGGGAGYVAAPNGTTVTFTLLPGSVGAFIAGNTCTTASGACTVTTTSSTGGTDTIQASATVTVGGVTMTRTTGLTAPGHANSANATKTWVPSSTPETPTTPAAPAISITKNPKAQAIATGSTATFTIVVTNTGNVTLTNVNVTDALAPNCAQTSASIPALASMAANASVTYTCALANVTAGFTNLATATGTPPSGPNVTATDTAPVTVTAPFTPPKALPASKKKVAPKKAAPLTPPSKPRIAIVKSPKSQTLTTKIVTTASGSSATYGNAQFTIKVTNVGNVTLTAVKVADALSPECNRSLGTLTPGASRTYSCTRKAVKRNFTNIAVASGKPPKGARVTATDHAVVKVTVKTTATSPAKFTG